MPSVVGVVRPSPQNVLVVYRDRRNPISAVGYDHETRSERCPEDHLQASKELLQAIREPILGLNYLNYKVQYGVSTTQLANELTATYDTSAPWHTVYRRLNETELYAGK
ncbi:hypothetical protein TNCV_4573541 [Trichonephila clavipes]|nr:hypothetical protein TNCV_4573541 [Trichonephila clavipes]